MSESKDRVSEQEASPIMVDESQAASPSIVSILTAVNDVGYSQGTKRAAEGDDEDADVKVLLIQSCMHALF